MHTSRDRGRACARPVVVRDLPACTGTALAATGPGFQDEVVLEVEEAGSKTRPPSSFFVLTVAFRRRPRAAMICVYPEGATSASESASSPPRQKDLRQRRPSDDGLAIDPPVPARPAHVTALHFNTTRRRRTSEIEMPRNTPRRARGLRLRRGRMPAKRGKQRRGQAGRRLVRLTRGRRPRAKEKRAANRTKRPYSRMGQRRAALDR